MVDHSARSAPASPASPAFYGPGLTAEMSRISKFKVTRASAFKWAKTLNFLVYDDSDDTPEKVKSCPHESAGLEDTLPIPHRISAGQQSDDDPKVNDQEEIVNNVPFNTTTTNLPIDCEYLLEPRD